MHVFFSQRVKKHQQQMQRYLKYVFNDHFALLMTLLLGAGGLYYSNFLKTLTPPFSIGRFVVVLIFVLALTFGRYASLTKPADQLFLLPKEIQMRTYLQKALRYSCIVPFAGLFLIVGAVMPLYAVSTAKGFSQFFILLLMMWSLKWSHLLVQQARVFLILNKTKQLLTLSFWLYAFVTIVLGIFVTPLIGLILGVLAAVGYYIVTWKKQTASLDWEVMIDMEQDRLYRVYQFINLFTDVPAVKAVVRRRKYADVLLARIKKIQSNTYLYLYSRQFVRGTEYSGLFIRLVAIYCVMLYFIEEYWIVLILGVLFLYLIGFQMIPMYHRFRYMLLSELYPVSEGMQKRSFRTILTVILMSATLVFAIGVLLMQPLTQAGIIIFIFLAFDLFFLYVYVPQRLKKMAKMNP